MRSRPAFRAASDRVRPAQGFSLVELMVSIAIGLVIVAATTSMLVSSNRSNAELARSGQINESGRFALQIMANEVARAGFWGGWIPKFDDLRTTGAPTDYPAAFTPGNATDTPAIPDPCKTYANWSDQYKTNIIAIPVQVYESDAVPTDCKNGTGSASSLKMSSLQPGTDVLIVRGVEPCVAGSSAACTGLNAGEVLFQRALCTADTTPYRLTSDGSTLTLRTRDCPVPAPAASAASGIAPRYRYTSTIFYVRPYAVTAGDGVPTLMMSQFGLSGVTLQHNTAEPIIPGVQGFRVDLGIDSLSKTNVAVDQTVAVSWKDSTNLTTATNRGDGVPDTWVRCTTAVPCTLAQLTNVVAVRLNLLVRSETTTSGYTDAKTYTLGAASAVGPYNDSYRRRVYSQTVRVNNVAMRRETP